MNSKNIMKKSPSSLFLWLLGITLLILAYSSSAVAITTAYFWVYAKSSIEKLDPYTAPPGALGLDTTEYATQHSNIRSGCNFPLGCPPAPFDETPNMSTISGSQEPSGEFRLYGHFRIEARCNSSTVLQPYWGQVDDAGGYEGTLPPGGIGIPMWGSAHMDPDTDYTGGAYVIDYVLSGQPNSAVEANAFTPVKARGNKKIWQKGRVILGCTSSGTPTAWLSTSSSNWKGSAFPTHNVSLWNGNSSGPTGSSPRQTLQEDQGKFWELWDLDSVPSP